MRLADALFAALAGLVAALAGRLAPPDRGVQRKLSTLEDAHAALSVSHQDARAALEAAKAEGAALHREVRQMLATVEKLEAR